LFSTAVAPCIFRAFRYKIFQLQTFVLLGGCCALRFHLALVESHGVDFVAAKRGQSRQQIHLRPSAGANAGNGSLRATDHPQRMAPGSATAGRRVLNRDQAVNVMRSTN
jgi:hypothetical protein